jgi:hypothetical protein
VTIWVVVYFPAPDDRDSPFKYILGLSDVTDQAAIFNRLKLLCERGVADWPTGWYRHLFDKVFEFKIPPHRLMYCLDTGKIVILHACRKASQKARKLDLERARLNYKAYQLSKSSSKTETTK